MNLTTKKNLKKDKEKVNLALIGLTSSETESGSEFDEENEVFFKLIHFNLITFIQ